MDGGTTNITLVDPASGKIKGTMVQDAKSMGNLDSKMDRQFLYVLKSAPYITVTDNTGLTHGGMPKEIQSFSLSALGSRQGFQGLAIYPSS